jgi:hypothetical protein
LTANIETRKSQYKLAKQLRDHVHGLKLKNYKIADGYGELKKEVNFSYTIS